MPQTSTQQAQLKLDDQTAEGRATANDHMRQCVIWTTRLVLAGVAHTARGAAVLEDIDPDTRRLVGFSTRAKSSALTVTALKTRLAALQPDKPARSGPLFQNVTMLGDALALSVVERDILALAVMMATTEGVNETFWPIAPLAWSHVTTILASALDAPLSELRAALRPSSPLLATRLVKRGRVRRHEEVLQLLDGFGEVMLEEHAEVDTLVAHLFSPAPEPTLVLTDFPHLTQDLALLVPILTTACRERTVGFDALIHGPPGTGKTELARVVAQAIGARLYEVNVSDDDGEALDRSKRLAAWTLSQQILGHKVGSLVLFDEAEDVFPRGGGLAELLGMEQTTSGGKGWMNRALETHAVPTVWISNAIGQIDPAYLRRFDIVVEVRPPPAAIRRQVLEKHMSALPVGEAWLDRASHDERIAPAHVERAARALRMLETENQATAEAALDRLLEPQLDRVGARRVGGAMACGPYDLSLVNASHDVNALAAALAKNPRGTLCLYGPPGTGKTAFVQHLATATGLGVLQKRGSDLMGAFVGETEKAIAAMFRQARDEKRLLFLDEADSFLQDRASATRQWEVAIVNELLVQMEAFDGLFVCATNLIDSLDRASLRRFSLKIRFDALTADQRWQMLNRMCATPPEDALRARLDQLETLAAGDFAAVARQLAMLGTGVTAEAVVAALEEEAMLKGRTTARKVAGFR